jgi:1-acyl-sn-glycerol-3-phosphate acyltransferase
VNLRQRFIVVTFKALTNLLCRIDDRALAQVPARGPLILVTNHVNILEVPIIYTHLQPRPVNGMVLGAHWRHPFMRWILDGTASVPLYRGEPNFEGLRKGIELLKQGRILVISPEGTRSGHGRLQKAHPGFIPLALTSGAPLIPVAYSKSENWKENVRRLRRTDFHIAVGQAFKLQADGARIDGPVRQQMVDEVMYRIAALLPEQYRGIYSDLGSATQKYLNFEV